jgi:hypothetical protein
MASIAPRKFARWLAKHEHKDPRFGYVYRYHPRSDAHSIALCRFVLEDLLHQCPPLKAYPNNPMRPYMMKAKAICSMAM